MKTTLISALALTLGLTGAMPALAFPKSVDGIATLTGTDVVPMLDLARRGRGADDKPGDTRRGRGADDGPNHASNGDAADGMIILARRGRGGDDGPGHDAGDDHGGRGRGSDDGAGHDAGDDHGGDRARGSSDDNGESGSGRKKPRVPGGSGCDDAGDAAEHPECS